MKNYICSACSKPKEVKPDKRGSTPQPKGWKVDPSGSLLCDKCIKDTYVTRSFELPVVQPLSMEWSEFRKLIDCCWQNATTMANWAVGELCKNDVVRTPAMTKLPPMPSIYLYGIGVKTFDWKCGFWKGACQSVLAVITKAQQNYQKERFAVVWRREAAPPCFKYPFPFPVDKDAFAVRYEDNRPVVDVSLPGGRVSLLLRSGPEFSRQLSLFRLLQSGVSIPAEIAIGRRKFHGSNSQATTDRTPGGGSKQSFRVMVKFVARFPRGPKSPVERPMLIRTDPNAFLVCEIPGRAEPFILNCDELPRRVKAHRIRLQRIGEDTKYEKRWPKPKRLSINEHREIFCDRHNAWLDTFMHTTSKMVSEFACRQKVAEATFDPLCKTFVDSFPWYRFTSMLKYKLEGHGISLVAPSSTEDSSHEISTQSEGV